MSLRTLTQTRGLHGACAQKLYRSMPRHAAAVGRGLEMSGLDLVQNTSCNGVRLHTNAVSRVTLHQPGFRPPCAAQARLASRRPDISLRRVLVQRNGLNHSQTTAEAADKLHTRNLVRHEPAIFFNRFLTKTDGEFDCSQLTPLARANALNVSPCRASDKPFFAPSAYLVKHV